MANSISPSSSPVSQTSASLLMPLFSKDVILKIFGNLSAAGAVQAGRVCKQWNQLSAEDSLWKSFLARDFLYHYPEEGKSFKQIYQKEYAFNRNLIEGNREWKRIHDRGWTTRLHYSEVRVEKIYHARSIHCLALASDQKSVFSATQFSEIKRWDLATCKCIQTLSGHDMYTSRIICTRDEQLISGGCDEETKHKIKVWDLKTGKCVQTLLGHTANILNLWLTKEKFLISDAEDGGIKIWDLKQGHCIRNLSVRNISIANSVEIQSEFSFSEIGKRIEVVKELFFATYEKGITKVWDLKADRCVEMFTENQEPILDYDQDGRALLTLASENGKSRGWILATPFFRFGKISKSGCITSGSLTIKEVSQGIAVEIPKKLGFTEKELIKQKGAIISSVLTQRGQLIYGHKETIEIFDYSIPRTKTELQNPEQRPEEHVAFNWKNVAHEIGESCNLL